jgi:arabinan endo-1,5-alpha-L-arabinosidase
MPGPAAQPGQETAYEPEFIGDPEIGRKYADLSDQFGGKKLDEDQWTWVREPDPATWELAHGKLTWQTQSGDLQPDTNPDLASVLTQPAPEGDYAVVTKVMVNVPPDICCQNFVQGGIVIYGDDGNYLKLVEVSIFNTRQTEFGRKIMPVPEGYPTYGNTVVGPVGDEWTWLAIVVDEREGEEDIFTPYTSRDGENWDRGGAWTHELGEDERIGLVSMGGTGYETTFDYLRVYEVLDPATIE